MEFEVYYQSDSINTRKSVCAFFCLINFYLVTQVVLITYENMSLVTSCR